MSNHRVQRTGIGFIVRPIGNKPDNGDYSASRQTLPWPNFFPVGYAFGLRFLPLVSMKNLKTRADA